MCRASLRIKQTECSECQHQHLYSRHILISHQEVLLIKCSASDSDSDTNNAKSSIYIVIEQVIISEDLGSDPWTFQPVLGIHTLEILINNYNI